MKINPDEPAVQSHRKIERSPPPQKKRFHSELPSEWNQLTA